MKMNKLLVLASIVMLSCALFGCDYFLTDKNPSDKKRELAEKSSKDLSPEKRLEFAEKCSKAGKAYFDNYIRTNLPDGFFWDEPEYHYSARLNTCLVHIRYVNPGTYISMGHSTDSSHRNQVIDIFANKVLLRGWFEREPKSEKETLSTTFDDAPNFTSHEYFKRKDELFSE